MSTSGRNFFLYVIPILMVLAVITNVFFEKSSMRVTQTSLLALINNVIEFNNPSLPDLSIDSVSLEKVSDPVKNYNFYKYKVTLVAENLGGNLKDATVVISAGKDQKYSVVRTDKNGFSLKCGDKYIINDYYLISNGDYSSADFEIELTLKDFADINLENNVISTSAFESDTNIGDMKVKELTNDGYLTLNIDAEKFNNVKHNLYLFTSETFEPDEGSAEHFEYYKDKVLYEYSTVKNSQNILESDAFEKKEIKFSEPGLIKFDGNPFIDGKTHTLYFMAVDSTTFKYALSDLLVINPSQSINKAQFAKLFVEYADISLDNTYGYYNDVSDDEWYAGHVSMLFRLGLLDTDKVIFEPNETVTRGYVLKKVMEYFDVDLALPITKVRYEDADSESDIYPYVQAFSSIGDSNNLSERFKPDYDATKDFLKYLIDAYKKNN